MLARLLRRALLIQSAIGLAIGYGLAQPQGAWLLVMAAWGIAFPMLTLVLTCLVSALLSRNPGPLHLWWRALWGEMRASVVVFVLRQPWTTRAPAVLEATAPIATPRVPVVLVHGYLCNHRFWDDTVLALRAQGHVVLAVDLEPVYTSIDHYAPLVERAVQELRSHTGKDQVALVGHSMGGLAIRAWLRQHGSHHAARVLTLGTPHVGTRIPQGLPTPNGQQMEWHSPWLAALAASETLATRQRMQIALSAQDNIVYPQRDQVLEGAEVTVFEGLGHLQLGSDRQVIQWVLQRLEDPIA